MFALCFDHVNYNHALQTKGYRFQVVMVSQLLQRTVIFNSVVLTEDKRFTLD